MPDVRIPVGFDLQTAHDQAVIMAEAWSRYARALAESPSVCDHLHQTYDELDRETARCHGCGRVVPEWVMA